MASFPFAITIQSTPDIEVYGVNITYEEILNSFANYYYLIQKLYLETRTISQANEPLSFEKYDSNGNKNTQIVSPAIDPYGKQSALVQDMEQYKIIADGRLTMAFNVLPLAWIRFTFFTCRGYTSQCLNDFHPSNQQQVKEMSE